MMTEKEMLDKYIDEKYNDCKPWLTAEQRKAISETTGFALYRLRIAADEFKSAIKAEFSWIFGDK